MLVVRIIAASLVAVALLLPSDRLAIALDFNKGTCPSTFTVGMSYPNLPETTVCRQLQTYISRDSDRFRIEMVTNVDTTINFANSDARIMCSRMQSKLGQLRKAFTGSFTVLKAWAEYPDPNITEPGSLHYDGKRFHSLSLLFLSYLSAEYNGRIHRACNSLPFISYARGIFVYVP